MDIRPNRACIDAVANLTLSIESAFSRKKDVSAVFFDLKGAFGTIRHEIIINILENLGFSNYSLLQKLLDAVTDFCSSRGLELNANKYKLVHFSRARKLRGKILINVNNIELENVNEFKFLGITIDKKPKINIFLTECILIIIV